MARGPLVPEAGDIIWKDFDPQAGHRPAVGRSRSAYNGRVGLAIWCPVTTRVEGYPFEVRLAGGPPSVALADQVKNLDWRKRLAQRKGRASDIELATIRAKLLAVIA